MLWYQPLAEMQAFSERTGGGLGGLCGFGTPSPYEQARQQFDLLKARLGDGWPAQVRVALSPPLAPRLRSTLSLHASAGRLHGPR